MGKGSRGVVKGGERVNRGWGRSGEGVEKE